MKKAKTPVKKKTASKKKSAAKKTVGRKSVASKKVSKKASSSRKQKMAALKGSEIFLRAPDALFRLNLDGNLTVIRTNDLEFHYTINGLAAEMWKQLDGRKTVADILRGFEKKSGSTTAELLVAASPFLTDLLGFRLLRRLA